MRDTIELSRKCTPEDHRDAPKVAAALVQNGVIIASAYRGELAPGDHAEFTLLEKKLNGRDLTNATLITTLEPCTSRNDPKVPCADRIRQRGIKRVFVGMIDPNPDITGRGLFRLREGGCSIDFFPAELMTRVEEINRDFISQHRVGDLDEPSRLAALTARELDAWYLALNRIYWHRNAHADLSYVFAHLVEVVGGLSFLASEKSKPHIEAEAYVQKAIAWWLALCGKAGVVSATDLVWRKFPGVCPYCRRSPHNEDGCREFKARNDGPDWEALAVLGDSAERPRRPSEWLRMFRGIYPVSQGDTYGPTFARLSEELGELAEAVRLFDEEPQYFLSEAADVFAWLMRIENIRETKRGTPTSDIGVALDAGLARSYPDFCLDCEAKPCRCPAILKRTVGRIAKEVPQVATESSFMTAENRRVFFGA